MPLIEDADADVVPLHLVESDRLADWSASLDDISRNWVKTTEFKAGLGETIRIPDAEGGLAAAAVGWGDAAARSRDRFHLARAANALPEATYELETTFAQCDLEVETLGWLLSQYRFDRYCKQAPAFADLVCPKGVDSDRLRDIAEAANLAQNLINTPARDMGPSALETEFVALAQRCNAKVQVLRGEELEADNLPLIAAVGAAASEAPRLLDMTWGANDAPKVTIVGKGVCFDTGGLNIKPGASMGLMKKDMGGAANAMALAQLVMARGLPVRLRLLVPAVENAISSAAMRPGDIIKSRKGLTVEINNTDAEGRLVLADALALADEETPELMVSLATLTGAARVALGPDAPPYFTDDDALALDLAAAAQRVADPLWRLPFWTPYEELIEPGIADLDNAPPGGMAGAITAALFLRRFVTQSPRYLHIDLYGWTPKPKPGRPKGGACQAARAIFDVLESRFG